jgi:hypothetical protein
LRIPNDIADAIFASFKRLQFVGSAAILLEQKFGRKLVITDDGREVRRAESSPKLAAWEKRMFGNCEAMERETA